MPPTGVSSRLLVVASIQRHRPAASPTRSVSRLAAALGQDPVEHAPRSVRTSSGWTNSVLPIPPTRPRSGSRAARPAPARRRAPRPVRVRDDRQVAGPLGEREEEVLLLLPAALDAGAGRPGPGPTGPRRSAAGVVAEQRRAHQRGHGPAVRAGRIRSDSVRPRPRPAGLELVVRGPGSERCSSSRAGRPTSWAAGRSTRRQNAGLTSVSTPSASHKHLRHRGLSRSGHGTWRGTPRRRRPGARRGRRPSARRVRRRGRGTTSRPAARDRLAGCLEPASAGRTCRTGCPARAAASAAPPPGRRSGRRSATAGRGRPAGAGAGRPGCTVRRSPRGAGRRATAHAGRCVSTSVEVAPRAATAPNRAVSALMSPPLNSSPLARASSTVGHAWRPCVPENGKTRAVGGSWFMVLVAVQAAPDPRAVRTAPSRSGRPGLKSRRRRCRSTGHLTSVRNAPAGSGGIPDTPDGCQVGALA